MMAGDDTSGTEQGVRIGFSVLHSLGGVVATAFGGGALVKPIGEFEENGLNSLFNSKKINPSGAVKETIASNKSLNEPDSSSSEVNRVYGIRKG